MNEPTLGDRIAARRRGLGMTQEVLAEAAEVDVSTIKKLEQGKRTSACVATLSRLAQALDASVSELLGDTTEAEAATAELRTRVARLEARADGVAIDIRQLAIALRAAAAALAQAADALQPPQPHPNGQRPAR